MHPNQRHEIVQRQGLGERELPDAAKLVEVCDQAEGLELPLNLATPDALGRNETDQLLYYEEGALIGFMSLDFLSDAEICLAVDPEHRRRGVGSALYAAARERCRQRGLTNWLLVTDEASPSGKAFVRAMGADYRFTEYRMQLEVERFVPPAASGSLTLHPACTDDIAAFARLKVAESGGSEEAARERVARDFRRPNHQSYLARVNGEPVGTIRVGLFGSAVYLTSVGVHPEHRGRGYGRQILACTIESLLAESRVPIKIEVDSQNPIALSLYRSCGFRETCAYGFYEGRQ